MRDKLIILILIGMNIYSQFKIIKLQNENLEYTLNLIKNFNCDD